MTAKFAEQMATPKIRTSILDGYIGLRWASEVEDRGHASD